MCIKIKNLNVLDEIRILTWNSEYRFRVTDPSLCKGILTGGLLGDKLQEAVLTGSVMREPFQSQPSSRLEIGNCALFYLASEERVRCLTTSTILEVSLNPEQNYS